MSFLSSSQQRQNVPKESTILPVSQDKNQTFLNCMTRFIRLLAAEPALSVPVVDDCNKSSIEILFLIA